MIKLQRVSGKWNSFGLKKLRVLCVKWLLCFFVRVNAIDAFSGVQVNPDFDLVNLEDLHLSTQGIFSLFWQGQFSCSKRNVFQIKLRSVLTSLQNRSHEGGLIDKIDKTFFFVASICWILRQIVDMVVRDNLNAFDTFT